MKEELKSVEEIAKASRDITTRIADFFDKYFEKPLVEMGGIGADWMKYFRYRNMLVIYDKVIALHEKRRIEGKITPIPMRAAIPLLEAASAEDNETLQDLWARLIANATDPSTKIKIHPSYIEVIKQLDPNEAKIIAKFAKHKNYPFIYTASIRIETSHPAPDFFDNIYERFKKDCLNLGISDSKKATAYLDNLKRLRIIEVGYNTKQKLVAAVSPKKLIQGYNLQTTRDEYLLITEFGNQFIQACIRSR